MSKQEDKPEVPPSPPQAEPADAQPEAAAPRPPEPPPDQTAYLSQWELIKRRFRRHRLAVIGLYALAVLYTLAIFAELFAPYSQHTKVLDRSFSPPQIPHFSFEHGLYVPSIERHVDQITFKQNYIVHEDRPVKLGFFVKGQKYKLWGLIPWDRHFLGPEPVLPEGDDASAETEGAHQIKRDAAQITAEESATPVVFFLGADKYGRCLFSRLVHGARISLSIGLIAIAVTSVLGITLGGISGYVGGKIDTLIQRSIEIVRSFPRLPLWMALGAAVPPDWSPLKTYLGITIVLSLLGWTGLARVVRGKLLSLREEDYAVAARLIGASHARIIFRHLVPGFTSHIIVGLTLAIPAMILGETTLSFLGLGLRPPVVSWGVMLQDAMSMQIVANYPWLLMPVPFLIITVLCFNFVGDGMRDAADPYH